MPNYTSNYSFVKPKKGENYDVDQTTNTNMDLIDTELFKKVNKIPGKDLSTNDFTDNYKFKIDTMSNIYMYKGVVETVEELPSQGNKVGDVYSVENENASFAWDGTQWNSIGNIINLEAFYEILQDIYDTIGDLDDLTTTQKDSIVNAINEIVTNVASKVATTDFNTAITNLTNNKMNNKYYESTIVTNTADFKINSTTALESGVEFKIHFAQCSSSGNARLSVDNGTNFYNIDSCTGQALSDEYLAVMFDGTKFVYMTGLGPAAIEYVQEVQNNA